MMLKIILLMFLLIVLCIIPFRQNQAVKNLMIITGILIGFFVIILLTLAGYHWYSNPHWFREYLF